MKANGWGEHRYIGIDGGGTKTTAIIGDEQGSILGIYFGDSANVRARAREDVENSLINLIQKCLRDTDSQMRQVAGMTLALAGAHHPTEKQRMTEFLKSKFPGITISVHSDTMAAWAAGTWGEAGIVAIAGTGSVAYGRIPKSDIEARAGGWGHLLGDEGSGYDISRKALQAIIRNHDRQEPPTSLTSNILRQLSLNEPEALVDWSYDPVRTRKQIAGLSVYVMEAASLGDTVALGIIEDAVSELCQLVHSVQTKLSPKQPLPVIAAGGLFNNHLFYKKFANQLNDSATDCLRLEIPPAAGAYYMSLLQGVSSALIDTVCLGQTIQHQLCQPH
ncbi:N-acetylglucosamine kinase [Paenibacillus illinoisensis]|uniref:N-acetylglucosamine kinase n=1 Tax=Paenibacillus illinoisensis TaxID=59845 RepID=UPI0034A82079